MFMKIPRKQDKINPIQGKISEIVLIAENIRSSENVGSFFRTSDALGINQIFLVGYTPSPIDKFNRPDSKIAKTALGAEKTIEYEKCLTLSPLLKKLRKEDFIILALELDVNAVDYRNILNKLKKENQNKELKIALIVGNEVTGVTKGALKNSDHIIAIPMRGTKESLNVSVATAIALAELTRDFK